MESRYHFAVSLVFALYEWQQLRFLSGALCLVLGWLIDADHVIDYYISKRVLVNPIRLSQAVAELNVPDMSFYLLLHGYEWLVVGIAIGVPLVPIVAFAMHLLMDIMGNNIHPFLMSIIVRAGNNWKRKEMIKKEEIT